MKTTKILNYKSFSLFYVILIMVINMKRIILYITIISILTGCNIQNNNPNNKEILNNNQEQSNNEKNNEEIIDTYKDKNPVKVALYENNKIVKTYNTTLSNYKDIAVFDVYYTNDEEATEKNTK